MLTDQVRDSVATDQLSTNPPFFFATPYLAARTRFVPDRAQRTPTHPTFLCTKPATGVSCQQTACMNITPSYRWLPLLFLGFWAGNALAAHNVRIEFDHPERFSDFRIQDRQEIASASIFRDEISNYLSWTMSRRFPGATLTLKFTDIDLAGRLEPWRISRFPRNIGVRFARNMESPLRLYFDYTLTDPKGRVLANGSASVVEVDYLHRYFYYSNHQRSDTLFYEKAALDRWLNSLSLTPGSENRMARASHPSVPVRFTRRGRHRAGKNRSNLSSF